MIKKLVCLAAVLTALILPLVPNTTVCAIADPSSAPQVRAVDVYQNLLETGDVGVLIDYYLDYAVLPPTGETATESFLAVLIDTDGTTQLKSAAPYTYVTSGYRRGQVWIYFSAVEAATYSLNSTGVAAYRVWLTGNPTLTWTPSGSPSKTIATIDDWHTVGDPKVLLALKVLYYADQLELIWLLNMVDSTPLGTKLASAGESYFTSVIPNLRDMAPSAFMAGTASPVYNPISYDTAFGARASSGTATVVGSPVTLVDGTNVIDTGATVGTIVLDLAGWTAGNVTDLTGTVTGSPVPIHPGTNTLIVTGAGTFTVNVTVVDTVTKLAGSVVGTGFDLSSSAAAFGMSRWMFSGLIWMLITVIICAAVFATGEKENSYGGSGSPTKDVMVVFTVCVIGGTLLGLLHPIVAALLFIFCGVFIGYIIFFRSESLHKGFMFMVWMFVITSLAGNMVSGSASGVTATYLTADVVAGSIDSISVASTAGFPDAGIVVIGDERIGYPTKTATAFERAHIGPVTTNPMLRGVNSTTDAAHAAGSTVRTVEASVLNASMDYKIANFADASGLWAAVTFPVKLLDLVMTFLVLPLSFLGSDLAILTYIWMIVAVGMIVGFVTALAGGRRV